MLVAGAIAGKITVEGLSTASTQADKEIMKALIDSGADVKVSEEGDNSWYFRSIKSI